MTYGWLLSTARRGGVQAVARLAGWTRLTWRSWRSWRSLGARCPGCSIGSRCSIRPGRSRGAPRPGRAGGSRGSLAGRHDDGRRSRLGRSINGYRVGRTARAASGWRIPEEIAQHHRNDQDRHDDCDRRPGGLAVDFACVESHYKSAFQGLELASPRPPVQLWGVLRRQRDAKVRRVVRSGGRDGIDQVFHLRIPRHAKDDRELLSHARQHFVGRIVAVAGVEC